MGEGKVRKEGGGVQGRRICCGSGGGIWKVRKVGGRVRGGGLAAEVAAAYGGEERRGWASQRRWDGAHARGQLRGRLHHAERAPAAGDRGGVRSGGMMGGKVAPAAGAWCRTGGARGGGGAVGLGDVRLGRAPDRVCGRAGGFAWRCEARAGDRGGGMGPGRSPCGGTGCGRHPLLTWEGSRCRRRRRPRQPSPPPPLIGRRLPRPLPVRLRRGCCPCQALAAAWRACSVLAGAGCGGVFSAQRTRLVASRIAGPVACSCTAAGGPLPPSRGAARQVGAGRSLTRRGPPCGYSHESGPGGVRARRRQRVAATPAMMAGGPPGPGRESRSRQRLLLSVCMYI
jgi:hypothetical protein